MQVYNNPAAFFSKLEINEAHRARMIDWLIQVYRAFGIESSKTLFLSIFIIDKYIRSKGLMGDELNKFDLHEIGLVSVLLSFKYEYDNLVSLNTLLREAGHGKFSKQQINIREVEVLKLIGFDISVPIISDEALTLILSASKNISKEDRFLLSTYIDAISIIVTLNLRNLHLDFTIMSNTIAILSLKALCYSQY